MGALMFVYLILFGCCVILSSSSLSGLYVDNGLDQTVIQRFITRHEKRNVEHEILNLLGLPERPRPRRFASQKSLGSSGPKFLLDVYKSTTESSSSRSPRSQLSLSDKDLAAAEESDAVMSFNSHAIPISNVRQEKGRRLWFDVTEVPIEDSVVTCELRIYQTGNTSIHEGYSLEIYMILNNEETLELVEKKNTSGGMEGWVHFNMTGPLTQWVAFPRSNKGLYLTLRALSSGMEQSLDDLGIVIENKNPQIVEEREPFMVAFLRTPPGGSINRGNRVRRARQTQRRKKKTARSETSYSRNPLTDMSIWSQSHRSCQIQTLYVSFRDLEWQDWIIAPDGYGAFYCSGECNFPLNAHMNATNHAIVQTLVHLMNPLQVPKPCCAPTKLTPISVLYFSDDSNVILKKYKNMVVKSCGCH